MLPQWIIEKKRDGQTLSQEEIEFLIQGYCSNSIPDYQMSAFAMAVYFRGLSFEETQALTQAMLRSGDIVDTSAIPLPKFDKHSTGGIGDKVSLILAPLVACCGIAVPMISGRGLGITGGTLDKLESITGYRTNLEIPEFLAVIEKCGCSINGQTARLVPADKKLYALRDVTATVPSIGLIVSSIMSKKLAEGIDGLVLDVKVGSGAFMKDLSHARVLAQTMVEVGRGMHKKVVAVLSNMDEPLGQNVGNALEVAEVIAVLANEGPADLLELTLLLSAHMLVLAGKAASLDEAKDKLTLCLRDGSAAERFMYMVRLHGGQAQSLASLQTSLPKARIVHEVRAKAQGYIQSVNAQGIGKACLLLGAGRQQVSDRIDPAVGVSEIRKCGAHVSSGDLLLRVHANDENLLQSSLEFFESAFTISSQKPDATPLVFETIE